MFRIGEACVFFILIAIVLCGVGADARTLDSALMVTYGQDAAKAEGDDDHTQLLEIRVPAEFSESVYLRVFDADCDGVHDQAIGDFNTETRFSLYEGPVGEEETFAGAPLVALTFSRDAKYDNEWQSLGEIEPQRGTVTGTFRVFSLVVEGLAGNDGNIFDVALSVRPERNLPVEGGQILNFGPTIRLGNSESTAELAFEIPAGVSQLEISAFDAGQAPLAFSSRTHTHKLNTSGQGASSVTTVSLDPSEAGAAGALLFGGGGGENPNDASFVISAGDGSSLPVSWPVQVAVVNNRPTLVVETRPLADCRSFVFDAEKTFDPDGDLLEFEWQMGDGSTGRGRQTVHRYDESGIYHGRVIVTDDSGWVGSAATHAFTNIVNQRPVSEAGPDRIGQPGVEMFFDGSASQDEDGLLTGFLWSFGDGATAEGQAVGHTFEEPGRYTVSLDVFDDSKGPCDSATNSLQVWVNAAPVAEAGEDLACSVGEEITLDGGRSYDSDGRVIEYFWDFGDGSTGLGASLGHAF
ncbi:MAG: PKD domain-containing protein, partial [Acidobacteriota bacterium]